MARRRAGFTSLELIITLGLIGMLLFSLFPVLSNFLGNLKLKSEAEKVLSDLRFAQSRAEAGGADVSVIFLAQSLFGDPARYIIKAGDPATGSELTVKTVRLEGSFNFRAPAAIKFSRSGFPPPGGSGSVALEDNGGRVKMIVVSSAGRVRME